MRVHQIIFFAVISMFTWAANSFGNNTEPAPDASGAGADGPFVFYRDNQILVKQINEVNDELVYTAKSYQANQIIRLSCKAQETGDVFSFDIKGSFKKEAEVYPQPEKMLVISDIEGNFMAFKMMLLGAGVVDKDFNWTFGKGHLVLLGDMMDRGLDVTAVLWLAYKLDQESAHAGGKVHFILGNHEVMNLTGDHRYVRNKYFENAKIIRERYTNWYKSDAELGKWLRSKNSVERIGDRLFCHGGISPELAYSQLTITEVNEKVRNSLVPSQNTFTEKSCHIALSQYVSPLWYRGLARQEVKEHEMQAIMTWSQSKQIVIGHTLMNEIKSLYNGRVIAMDLQHEQATLDGFSSALWIENNVAVVINHEGKKTPLLDVDALVNKEK